jgi:broad specificity phosphatase PhoE
MAELIEAVVDFSIDAAYVSPLRRCRQTLESLSRHRALPAPVSDRRLIEQNYGNCEGLTIAEARQADPMLFAAWKRREDPKFPGGENMADVARRVNEFVDGVWRHTAGNSIVCTHNVVVRCLVGAGLGVPTSEWHRIQVPHLAPITIVQTKDFGWFVDLEETVERRLFADFLHRP